MQNVCGAMKIFASLRYLSVTFYLGNVGKVEKIFPKSGPNCIHLTMFRNQPTGGQHLVISAALRRELSHLWSKKGVVVLESTRAVGVMRKQSEYFLLSAYSLRVRHRAGIASVGFT